MVHIKKKKKSKVASLKLSIYLQESHTLYIHLSTQFYG